MVAAVIPVERRRGPDGSEKGEKEPPMLMDSPAACFPLFADHEELAEMCGLLAVPIRMRIVLTLLSGERNVSELCNDLKASQPTISHHLGLLVPVGSWRVGVRASGSSTGFTIRPRSGRA